MSTTLQKHIFQALCRASIQQALGRNTPGPITTPPNIDPGRIKRRYSGAGRLGRGDNDAPEPGRLDQTALNRSSDMAIGDDPDWLLIWHWDRPRRQ
jgi:hypothetical protein